jgi:hypothetical protein
VIDVYQTFDFVCLIIRAKRLFYFLAGAQKGYVEVDVEFKHFHVNHVSIAA